MRGLICENEKVVNIAKFKDLPEGWVKAPERAAIGDIDNGDGTFSAPPKPTSPEPTAMEKIDTLERSVTMRNMRCAILGDAVAISQLQSIEDQIDVIRLEL